MKRTSTFFSTGSTIFNLALSDKAFGGFGAGKMVNIIGDSFSGKTMEALTIAAEALFHKRIKKCIHDDAEQANEFDMPRLFGKKIADQIQPPSRDEEGEPLHSETIQDFHSNIDRILDEEEPFIYILDSLDALTSFEEKIKTKAMLDAMRKNKKSTGSYGMEKPKLLGQILRQIVRRLKQTQSLLIIISQTRDNIDPMSFTKKTRSGGRALGFYASYEVWLAAGSKIKRNELDIGGFCIGRITKNKQTGKRRSFQYPIYYDYGIDDIASCIAYLQAVGHWSKTTKVDAKELGVKATVSKLIKHIETNHLEKDLRMVVKKVWMESEKKLQLNRAPKYA